MNLSPQFPAGYIPAHINVVAECNSMRTLMRMCWTGTLGWICMHTLTVTPVRRIVILLVIGEEVAVARGPYEMGKGG